MPWRARYDSVPRNPTQTAMPRSPRPKDAATLILLRHSHGAAEVLLGQRNARHAFMPNRYVFPGGRVDAYDHRVRVASELRPEVRDRLERATTPARAHALAVAAVRETWEETGLLLAQPLRYGMSSTKRAPWDAFTERGLAPALDCLDYIYRAVTPPGRPRRFNARFFLADAANASGELAGDGELLDLRWVALDEALSLPIPQVTHLVLEEVRRIMDTRPDTPKNRPVPRFQTVNGRFVFDHE